MTEIKFNVLIAEDEENIGNFISTILKTNGYKPIIATTGNQAIQYAESYCPDVILLDLGLPDMDGIDVISEIRKWAVTPIIVISARNRESEKVKAWMPEQMTISPNHLAIRNCLLESVLDRKSVV